MTFDFEAYTYERVAWVNDALDRYTPSATAEPTTLHEAMRYSLLAKGKRIRPLLCIAGAEAVGGDGRTVLPMACALEMLHTFSLIHDDLPAMDDDDFRRGVPTSHKQFGEAIAILAGDALQTLAFGTVARHQQLLLAKDAASAPARVVRVLALFAEASGSLGMCGGQVDDMAHEGKPVTLETLRHIHARKTGALLTVSLRSGAILAGASSKDESALVAYGDQIGIAFQIVDDILDVTGDEATIGKPVGSDVKNDKATYPKLVGLDESRRMAREAVTSALESLTPFGSAADPLRAFARYIVDRNL